MIETPFMYYGPVIPVSARAYFYTGAKYGNAWWTALDIVLRRKWDPFLMAVMQSMDSAAL